MSDLKSIFQLISANNLKLIKERVGQFSKYLHLSLDGQFDSKDDNCLTWAGAGGTFLHIKNIAVPTARYLLQFIQTKLPRAEQELILSKLINARNAAQDTILHIASATGNIEMLKLILEYHGDIYARNAAGKTPLHSALCLDQNKYSECNAILCIHALTKHDEQTSESKYTSEDLGYIDFVDNFGNSALQYAQGRKDRINAFKALEFCKFRVTVKNELYRVVKNAKCGVWPKEKCMEILTSLSLNSNSGATCPLNKKYANGATIVHQTCAAGLDYILDIILKNFNANLLDVDNTGRTALHYSVQSDNLEGGLKCLAILLKHEQAAVIINSTSNDGKTALDIALDRNLICCTELLLSFGCNIYQQEMKPLEKTDCLSAIYANVPETIPSYLNVYGGFMDSKQPEANQRTSGYSVTTPELFYSFSPIIGLNNYHVLSNVPKLLEPNFKNSPYDGRKLAEETKYLINLLQRDNSRKYSKTLSHPLVQLFLQLKWQKLKWIFFAYQFLIFLLLILYSWFTLNIFTVECPYNIMMPTNTTNDTNLKIDQTNSLPTTRAPSTISAPGPPEHFWGKPYKVNDQDPYFHHKYDLNPFNPNYHPNFPNTFNPKSGPSSPNAFESNKPKIEKPPLENSCVSSKSKLIANILIGHSSFNIIKSLFKFKHSKIFHGHKTKLFQLTCGILMLFNCASIFWIDGKDVEDWRYTLAGFGLFVAWIGFVHQIGKIPQAGKYVSVLKTVSLKTFWLILPFTPFLVAFALAFRILLPGNQQFRLVPTGFVKTMVLMIGELEYTELFYNEDTIIVSPCSLFLVQLFFGLFIFLIPIILLNLLIGLAVNEISGIITNGTLHHLSIQLEQIHIMEKMLFWIWSASRKFCGKSKNPKTFWINHFLVVDKHHVNHTKFKTTPDFYSNQDITEENIKNELHKIYRNSRLTSPN